MTNLPVVIDTKPASLTPADAVATEHAALVAAVAAMPAIPDRPGDRYAPRGLTELWLRRCYERSRNTAKSYQRALRSWLDYCDAHGLDPLTDPRRADVDDWTSTMTARGGKRPSAATINARLSAVSSWYRYLISNEATDRNPVAATDRATVDRDTSTTPGLTDDQAAALLDHTSHRAADGDERSLRDHAVMMLLLTTGLRSGAVLHATRDALAHDTGHRVLNYVTKGKRAGRVVLVPAAADALDQYLAARDARTPSDAAETLCATCHRPHRDHLVVTAPYRRSPGDRPMTSLELRDMLRRLARAAGIPHADTLVPHSTRHTVVTSLLSAGVPLAEVQDHVGHADPRTTRRYDRARGRLDRSPAYRMASLLADHRKS